MLPALNGSNYIKEKDLYDLYEFPPVRYRSNLSDCGNSLDAL